MDCTTEEQMTKARPILDYIEGDCGNSYLDAEISKNIRDIFGDVSGAIFRAEPTFVPREDGPATARRLYHAWKAGCVIKIDPVDRVGMLYDLLMGQNEITVQVGNQVKTDAPLSIESFSECIQLCAWFFPEQVKRDLESGKIAEAMKFYDDKEEDYSVSKGYIEYDADERAKFLGIRLRYLVGRLDDIASDRKNFSPSFQ